MLPLRAHGLEREMFEGEILMNVCVSLHLYTHCIYSWPATHTHTQGTVAFDSGVLLERVSLHRCLLPPPTRLPHHSAGGAPVALTPSVSTLGSQDTLGTTLSIVNLC